TDPLKGPTLKIELLGTNIKERPDYFLLEVDLRLTFTNYTDRKILLLNKHATKWGQNIFLKTPDGKLSILFSKIGGRSYFNRESERKELLSLDLPSEKIREI